jgi:hypothetical protein
MWSANWRCLSAYLHLACFVNKCCSALEHREVAICWAICSASSEGCLGQPLHAPAPRCTVRCILVLEWQQKCGSAIICAGEILVQCHGGMLGVSFCRSGVSRFYVFSCTFDYSMYAVVPVLLGLVILKLPGCTRIWPARQGLWVALTADSADLHLLHAVWHGMAHRLQLPISPSHTQWYDTTSGWWQHTQLHLLPTTGRYPYPCPFTDACSLGGSKPPTTPRSSSEHSQNIPKAFSEHTQDHADLLQLL